MRVDMKDNEALMKVTLTIPTKLVQKHAEKILLGNGINPSQILIYCPKQYMIMVIVIRLYRSTKQVLWKKFS
jgi:hypothetical protein